MVDEARLRGRLGNFKHIMRNITLLRLLVAVAGAFALISLSAPQSKAAVGDIWETNNNQLLIFRPLGGTPSTFNAGLANPKGLVFDGNGHVYVAVAGNGTIVRFDIFDASGFTFATGVGSPVGLAIDAAGFLYVGDAASGNVYKFNVADGTKTTFTNGVGAPAGLVFDNTGNLFVADFNSGTIYKVASDGTKNTFANGLSGPSGLAFDSAGNLFEADSATGKIFKFTPGGTKSEFVTGLGRPYGVAFDSSGNLIVTDNARGATLRFNPAGVQSTVFASDFNTPVFLAIQPAAHQILNISTRGFVGQDEHVLIAGFIIGGNGPVGSTVVVRGLGPSLSGFGITDALQDPVLEVHDASGTLIASNNNYAEATGSQRVPGSLAPSDDREAALQLTLNGGAYTAVVRGVANSTGTALVEVYQIGGN
ncbi:MAG: hypothetical protein QOH88_1568 [Verrucomicrobiota bacterium]|jgi:sugar lactone lactonase YvrE